jgi:pimeloyl-ACP methyl ester carboxylesterase
MDADAFEHNQVDANGISIHTVSVGEGPLVVFCHGFPESWYSWRHQLPTPGPNSRGPRPYCN